MRLADRIEIPVGTANFLAGGCAAFSYWTFAMPADNVKSRVQGASLQVPVSVSEAARTIYREAGLRGFYRGFGICMLRAFPTNAGAFFVYEGLMRLLGAEQVCKDHITYPISWHTSRNP
jgi:solute carrier family 25 (mitochondrial carnitine/acylcarnitine transporter), member 20/29